MILCKENSTIIFDSKIKNEDINFLASAIKKMFSLYIKKPRILLNITPKFNTLVSILKRNANVKIVTNSCIGIFTYITHFGEYDLGIYESEDNGVVKLKFFSGSGYPLSIHEFSYFENRYNEKFKNVKTKEIHNSDFNNLFLNIKDRFVSKWSKSYINYLKKQIKNKLNIKVVSQNKLENYFLSKVYNSENPKYNLYCGKRIYTYHNNKILDLKKVLKQTEKIASITENNFIKFLLENRKEYAWHNDKLYVIKNAFDFENISKVIYISNHLF